VSDSTDRFMAQPGSVSQLAQHVAAQSRTLDRLGEAVSEVAVTVGRVEAKLDSAATAAKQHEAQDEREILRIEKELARLETSLANDVTASEKANEKRDERIAKLEAKLVWFIGLGAGVSGAVIVVWKIVEAALGAHH